MKNIYYQNNKYKANQVWFESFFTSFNFLQSINQSFLFLLFKSLKQKKSVSQQQEQDTILTVLK